MSAGIKSGGVGLRVGGVEQSDIPEDPAVEGRPSNPSMVGFRVDVLFELGTVSGHVHWQEGQATTWHMRKRHTSLWPCAQRIQAGFVSSHWIWFNELFWSFSSKWQITHLYLLNSTGQTARFAACILGPFPLHDIWLGDWGNKLRITGNRSRVVRRWRNIISCANLGLNGECQWMPRRHKIHTKTCYVPRSMEGRGSKS